MDFVGDQTIFEDESLVLELYATDVEGYAGNSENLYLQYSANVPWGGDSQYVQVGVIQNQVTFTPVANFNGELTLRVTVSDGTDLTEEEFNLTVLPINDAPEFITSSVDSVNEDELYNFDLDVSDIDNLNSDLNLTISSGPSWLSLSEFTLTGTPTDSDVGTSTILLNLSDGEIITSGTFEITVNAVNDPPVAENQSVVLNEDESVTIYVYGNDEDSQGLSFTIIDEPENGVLTSQREFATYVYNPSSNFYGTDSFTFRVSDGEFSSEGIVDLTINGVNDAPTASNEYIVLDENTTAPVYYIAEDVDGNDLSFVIVSGPNFGTLENGIYTPNSGYSGMDLFVYQAFNIL